MAVCLSFANNGINLERDYLPNNGIKMHYFYDISGTEITHFTHTHALIYKLNYSRIDMQLHKSLTEYVKVSCEYQLSVMKLIRKCELCFINSALV